MSIKLLSAAWDLDIGSTEKMVLMSLCDHANDDGVCWPSVSTICKKTSKSERTVQSALKWLKDNSYFSVVERSGTSPLYTLDPRKICTPAKSAPPQKSHPTPAKSAPHPRKSRTQTLIEPSRTPKIHKTRARDHELPDGWVPAQFGSGTKCRAIVDGWPPGEVEFQIERFTAHHRSRGNKFKEWQDAWKTWVLNSRVYGSGNRGGSSFGYRERDRRDGFERAIDRSREERIAAERQATGRDGSCGELFAPDPSAV